MAQTFTLDPIFPAPSAERIFQLMSAQYEAASKRESALREEYHRTRAQYDAARSRDDKPAMARYVGLLDLIRADMAGASRVCGALLDLFTAIQCEARIAARANAPAHPCGYLPGDH